MPSETISKNSWNNYFSRTPLVTLEYQAQRAAEARRQEEEVARRASLPVGNAARSLEERITFPLASHQATLADRISFPNSAPDSLEARISFPDRR